MKITSKILISILCVLSFGAHAARYQSFGETVSINQSDLHSSYWDVFLEEGIEILNQNPQINGIDQRAYFLNDYGSDFIKSFNHIHRVIISGNCLDENRLRELADNPNLNDIEIGLYDCPVNLSEIKRSKLKGANIKKIIIGHDYHNSSSLDSEFVLPELINLEYLDYKYLKDIDVLRELLKSKTLKTVSMNFHMFEESKSVEVLGLINANPVIEEVVFYVGNDPVSVKEAEILARNSSIKNAIIRMSGYDYLGYDLDKLMSAVAKIKTLESLEVDFDHYSLDALRSIASMKSLKKLKIQKSDNSGDSFFDYLAGLERLESLELTCKGFDNYVKYDQLERLKNLKELVINGCSGFNNSAANALLKNNAIQKLLVGHESLDDAGAVALSKIESLESLDVSFARIGDKGVKALFANPSIKHLKINHVPVSTGTIALVAENLGIEDLEVSSNKLIDSDIEKIASNPRIKRLVASDNLLTDQSAFALSASGITQLVLAYNRITEKGKDTLRESPQHLQLKLGCQFQVYNPYESYQECRLDN